MQKNLIGFYTIRPRFGVLGQEKEYKGMTWLPFQKQLKNFLLLIRCFRVGYEKPIFRENALYFYLVFILYDVEE